MCRLKMQYTVRDPCAAAGNVLVVGSNGAVGDGKKDRPTVNTV